VPRIVVSLPFRLTDTKTRRRWASHQEQPKAVGSPQKNSVRSDHDGETGQRQLLKERSYSRTGVGASIRIIILRDCLTNHPSPHHLRQSKRPRLARVPIPPVGRSREIGAESSRCRVGGSKNTHRSEGFAFTPAFADTLDEGFRLSETVKVKHRAGL
jgi:hypothetical protein